jgi:hypothetical protein
MTGEKIPEDPEIVQVVRLPAQVNNKTYHGL